MWARWFGVLFFLVCLSVCVCRCYNVVIVSLVWNGQIIEWFPFPCSHYFHRQPNVRMWVCVSECLYIYLSRVYVCFAIKMMWHTLCAMCTHTQHHPTTFFCYILERAKRLYICAFYLLNIQIKLSNRQFSGFYIFLFCVFIPLFRLRFCVYVAAIIVFGCSFPVGSCSVRIFKCFALAEIYFMSMVSINYCILLLFEPTVEYYELI